MHFIHAMDTIGGAIIAENGDGLVCIISRNCIGPFGLDSATARICVILYVRLIRQASNPRRWY